MKVINEADFNEFLRAAGLKRLSRAWAKLEIVVGLMVAVIGLKILPGADLASIAGGVLIVLGLYLAMAGHRSHLYLSTNRQTVYLSRLIEEARNRDPRP